MPSIEASKEILINNPKTEEDILGRVQVSESTFIEEFRQILIWPLALSKAKGNVAEDVKAEAARLDKKATPWKRINDPLFHIRNEVGDSQKAELRQEPYAEFVYFHDFVQRFLYPTSKHHSQGEAGFHLFERHDVKAVDVDLGEETFTLSIDRCNLYLFRTGVAILVLEVVRNASEDMPFKLSDVMRFQDLFRRVYTPYFEKGDGYSAGQTPHAVTWLGADNKPISPKMMPHSLKDEMERLIPQREPPVHESWQWLLGLQLRGYDNIDGAQACWRHVVDDRIPFMSYVRLKGGLEQISRENWVRLCFSDQPDSVPYDKTFVANFEEENCYDRFFDSGTRYMFCSYAMSAVGKNEAFFKETIRNQFRHMYFQMALIAHMEYATYLAFSSRISQAVEDASQHGGTRGRWFRDRILKIHDDFLEFIHIFRFTGVSNQLQGKEMFDLWRKHLRLKELFEDLQGELKSASDYLFAKEAREQTEAAGRLNIIAVAGVVLGLVFAFLGMNVIFGQDAPRGLWPGVGVLGLVLGITSAVALGIAWVTKWLQRPDDGVERPILILLLSFLGIGTFLAVVGGGIVWLR